MKNRVVHANSTFGPGPNHYLNACVGFNGGPHETFPFATYYHTSANALVLATKERGFRLTGVDRVDLPTLDSVIYTVAYNYRHGHELALKAILELCNAQYPFETRYYVKGHKIGKLTEELLRALDESPHGQVQDDEKAHLVQLASDCEQIDPTGQTFRYPFSNTGAFLLKDWSLINIERMSLAFKKAFDPLDRQYYHFLDAIDYEGAYPPKSWARSLPR